MSDGSDVRERNITRAFSFLDASGDGLLSEDDVMTLAERVCERFALTEGSKREAIVSAVRTWWRQLEEDCPSDGGRITREDFARATFAGRGDPEEYFRAGLGSVSTAMANAIDRDGDGLIEADEYATWFSVISLSSDTVAAAFQALDTDGDGRITHAEFIDGTRQLMLSQDASDPGTSMLGHE